MTLPDRLDLGDVLRVYQGSDGALTSELYLRLKAIGPAGEIAVNLFRACKTSGRAKVYRGRGHRGGAYDTKQWSMTNLCTLLAAHAEALQLRWGWGLDPKQPKHNQVLYVDIPTGQVSFHTEQRGEGPDYAGKWDECRNASPSRVCQWAYWLLKVPVEQGAPS